MLLSTWELFIGKFIVDKLFYKVINFMYDIPYIKPRTKIEIQWNHFAFGQKPFLRICFDKSEITVFHFLHV